MLIQNIYFKGITMKLNAIQKAQAYDSCKIMENQGSFAFYLAQAFTRADQTNAYKLFQAFPELFTQAKEAYADEVFIHDTMIGVIAE
jgi:hypothetical protein